MNEKILLSERQMDILCSYLINFDLCLGFLLLKAYKEKDSDYSSWIDQYENILGRPMTQWAHERGRELEQLWTAIGEDKARRVMEEKICFLIFITANYCEPYVLKGEVKKLVGHFYDAFMKAPFISLSRESYDKYVGARNPLEKLSIDLVTILNENIFTGARLALPASLVVKNIKLTIDNLFKNEDFLEPKPYRKNG